MIKGAFSLQKTVEFKKLVTKIFANEKFTMHKWQSNEPQLEDDETVSDGETTFAKQKFGNDNQTNLLGLIWDKENDKLC